MISLCLRRAEAVPLTAKITVSDIKGDKDFLEALLPHATRISDLSLTGFPSIEGVADDLPGFFASPIPNLTSLELEQAEEPTESFPSNETPAPPLFLSVSKLKSLYLTRTPLYPALCNIRSLVELKLVGYTTPFGFGKFIGFLRSNSDLELIILDVQFVEVRASLERFPSTVTSFPRLRQLSLTCVNEIDAKGLISLISFPSGVLLEVFGSQEDQYNDIRLFLPFPKIRELLTPITTIKCQSSPSREIHLSGNNSLFSFRSANDQFNPGPEFSLFNTTMVREFHAKVNPHRAVLFEPLSRFPALETLILLGVTSFPHVSLGFLAEKPVLCPSLKTIAFVDCVLSSRVIEELGEVVARRKNSTAAWLHRVVIVRRDGKLPDYGLIHRLRQFVPRVDVGISELPDLP